MSRDDTMYMLLASLTVALPASLTLAADPGAFDAYALLQKERTQQGTGVEAQAPAQDMSLALSHGAPGRVLSEPYVQSQDAAGSGTTSPAETAATVTKRFGEQNSLRLMVEGAWMNNWDSANMGQARLGAGWFFLENVELDMFITLSGVDQPGKDAFGGGFDLQVRWHLLAMENWSFFAEIGGGVLGTTHSVPAGGSPFNFTPNAGIGMTFALDESTRLYVGGSWYHISNAGTYARNPGRENMSLWVGLSFGL